MFITLKDKRININSIEDYGSVYDNATHNYKVYITTNKTIINYTDLSEGEANRILIQLDRILGTQELGNEVRRIVEK